MLFSALTPDQARQFNDGAFFDVQMGGGRFYRIHYGDTYNVHLYEGGKRTWRYCATPADNMPITFLMLSQLLMLKTDESRFLSIANRAE